MADEHHPGTPARLTDSQFFALQWVIGHPQHIQSDCPAELRSELPWLEVERLIAGSAAPLLRGARWVVTPHGAQLFLQIIDTGAGRELKLSHMDALMAFTKEEIRQVCSAALLVVAANAAKRAAACAKGLWCSMTPDEAFVALANAPRVAGPWVQLDLNPECGAWCRMAPDQTVVAKVFGTFGQDDGERCWFARRDGDCACIELRSPSLDAAKHDADAVLESGGWLLCALPPAAGGCS